MSEFITETRHPCAGLPKLGWPHGHSIEDAYEAPPFTWTPTPETVATVDLEYVAVFNTRGEALLMKRFITDSVIAKFDTFADAQLAAKALNSHEGL